MRTVRARMLERDQAPSVKPYGRAAAHRGGIWWSPTLLCAAAVLLVPGTNSSARAAAIRSVSAAAIPPGTGTGPSYCASVVTGGYELGGGSTSFDNVYPCGPEPGATFPSYGDVFQPSGGFQCTELANRFVFNAWGLQPIFGKSLDGAHYAQTLHAVYRSVALVPNGIAGQPYLTGDIVSFKGTHTSTTDGHVAVVIFSSYASGDNGNYSITIMEQNAPTQNPATATMGQENLTVKNWALQPAPGAWVTPYDFDALNSGWLWDSLAVPPDEGPGAFLTYDIACPIKGTCVVVGSYTDAKGYVQGLIETLSGGKWKAVQAPLPVKTSGNPEAHLFAVSCASATYCVAVGGFAGAGLVETLSGDPSAWKPKPYETLDTPFGLLAVACGAVGACVALSEGDSAGTGGGIIERLSNGTWKATSAPLPAPLPSEAAQAELDTVACPSSHSCVAVGDFGLPNANDPVPTGLNETFSGGNWEPSLNSSFEVPGHAIQIDLTWTSVACASTSLCVAAGWESGNFGPNGSWINRNVLETLSDGHLTGDIPPLPPSATYPSYVSQYQTVACAPGGTCIAGLSYGGRESFIETWSAGRWRLTQARIPSPNGGGAALAAACPTSTYCVLVGSSFAEAPLVDVRSGSQWATVAVQPGPGGEFPSPNDYLESVSCPTAGWCAALGRAGMVEQTPND
jgi:hypothetical protein